MSDAPTVHAGFHGPKCWVVSTLVGIVLGFLLTIVLPVKPAAHDESAASKATVVVETRADGSRALRLEDQTTIDLAPGFDAANPADVQRAQSLLPTQPDQTAPMSAKPAHGHGPAFTVPLIVCVPFALLLLSIAIMPFVSASFWHNHFPDFAFVLGSLVLTYCVIAYGSFGRTMMLHAGVEYYSFIALVGGLYIASGGILIDIRVRGRAWPNTLLLALGCVLANIVGTTGASVLLIRPFMRMNRGRLRPIHVVFFIFIVSNCAGCLTPIGDPPLYLGFLKGVPFFWTLEHLWPMWLVTNGLLLAMFFILDSRIPSAAVTDAHVGDAHEHRPIITGLSTLGFLALLVAGVFIDPWLNTRYGIQGWPVGATFQLIVAAAAYFCARPSIHHANQFTFAPVKEVGFLFVGIFLTMAPALQYLRANASHVGLESPTQFYFATGTLSAFLDNAPTYLSFLQLAFGVLHLPLDAVGIREFITSSYDVIHPTTDSSAASPIHFDGLRLLEAISLSAVFFGAMTYIGNGPNFMVKSIVDSAHSHAGTGASGLGVKMPSFFGYFFMAILILLPVIIINWLIFIR